jgi:hypothetical protein
MVSTFHNHHYHLQPGNGAAQFQNAAKIPSNHYSFDDAASGCYLTNYVNSIYNVDNDIVFNQTPDIPHSILSSVHLIVQPLLRDLHISYLRGPPVSEII